MTCLTCHGPLPTTRAKRGKVRKYCSRKCTAAGHADNEPVYLAGVKVTHARNDMALVGAVFCEWAGEPILASELAARIGEPEMAAWAGLLRPWVEAIHTDAGALLYARTCGSDEVRAAVAKHTRSEGDEDSTEAVEWRLESEAA